MVSWPKWNRSSDAGDTPQAPTVHVTPDAEQKLVEVLAGRGPDAALRISVQDPGAATPTYGMALEEEGAPGADDFVVEVGRLRVLVDRRSAPQVDGATVDFVDDPLRPGFKIDPPGTRQPAMATGAPPPDSRLDQSDPLTAAVQAVIEQRINPGIASHGGRTTLVAVKDDTVYVELGGGCVGCSMASVTLKQGVEQMIKQAVPQVREVVDVTDHQRGSNPYYTSSKGAESPFAQATKG